MLGHNNNYIYKGLSFSDIYEQRNFSGVRRLNTGDFSVFLQQ